MDEAVWEAVQAEEYEDATGGRHLVIGHLPDRVGLYVLVIEGDTIHVVARIVGSTMETRDANCSAFLRWVLEKES